uniref:Uncharacterized protein n=1 Tax=Chrysotila carterae TaxID=13221 RepID=A0A7S4FAH2_CHRCT|eukprot:6211369-Pleurochrysis_carterae.AAC.3
MLTETQLEEHDLLQTTPSVVLSGRQKPWEQNMRKQSAMTALIDTLGAEISPSLRSERRSENISSLSSKEALVQHGPTFTYQESEEELPCWYCGDPVKNMSPFYFRDHAELQCSFAGNESQKEQMTACRYTCQDCEWLAARCSFERNSMLRLKAMRA